MKYSSHVCRVGSALPPNNGFSTRQRFEMHRPRQVGAPQQSPSARGASKSGGEKVKRKEEETGSPGLCCPPCSLLSCLLFVNRFWWQNIDALGRHSCCCAGSSSPSSLLEVFLRTPAQSSSPFHELCHLPHLKDFSQVQKTMFLPVPCISPIRLNSA
jgi:hypothetical protein